MLKGLAGCRPKELGDPPPQGSALCCLVFGKDEVGNVQEFIWNIWFSHSLEPLRAEIPGAVLECR